jgi:GntR family transcriptional regulator, carbon starvation induced regulator
VDLLVFESLAVTVLKKARSPRTPSRTLSADVLHRLRNDIISCVLKPGDRLQFENLREIYDVSYSTLREALSRLASERLVVAEDHRGFIVAPISREDLLDLTDARVLVERECLRRAMANGDAEWEAQILSAYHRLDRVEMRLPVSGGVTPEWDERHFDFHECIVAGAGSPTLSEIRQSLFERARRYRRLSATLRKMPRHKRDEHRAIMEAVLARDSAVAQELLEAHIRETATNVLETLPAEVAPASS